MADDGEFVSPPPLVVPVGIVQEPPRVRPWQPIRREAHLHVAAGAAMRRTHLPGHRSHTRPVGPPRFARPVDTTQLPGLEPMRDQSELPGDLARPSPNPFAALDAGAGRKVRSAVSQPSKDGRGVPGNSARSPRRARLRPLCRPYGAVPAPTRPVVRLATGCRTPPASIPTGRVRSPAHMTAFTRRELS